MTSEEAVKRMIEENEYEMKKLKLLKFALDQAIYVGGHKDEPPEPDEETWEEVTEPSQAQREREGVE